MPPEKSELLRGFFDQIESQVQFGDHKASLLVAGDALLLAVSGGLIQMVAGCPANEFSVQCMHPSAPLALALLTALLLIVSLGCALRAARPAGIHQDPPPLIFLLSHIARLEPKEFVDACRAASAEDLEEAALLTIHGKAKYAAEKFRWLRYAVISTLLSLVSLVATVLVAALLRLAQ